MDQLFQDVRFALRGLRKRRGFTAVAVVTLALGTGATTAIFSVVNGVLLRPLPYPDSERIIAFWGTDRESQEEGDGVLSHPNFLDWKAQSERVESMALYSSANTVLTGQSEGAEVVPAAIVTPGFFRVMGAPPALGRAFNEEEDLPGGPAVVVLGHGFWRERFGGRPGILGETIELSGRKRQVVGVAPEGFDFPNGARLWLPVQNDDERCGRDCVYLSGLGRLAPGATVESAREELRAIARALEEAYPDANTGLTAGVAPLQEAVVGDLEQPLLILLLAVAMVLLIACTNVANLLLVRGATRTEEVAVRAALGAGRRRLFAQLLTENLVLALLGGIAGLGLAWWGVGALLEAAPPQLPRLDEISLDSTSLLFALGLAAAAALTFGLAPSMQVSGLPLATTLREGGRGGSGARRGIGRSALLVAEIGLSLMLLLAAGLLLRSLSELQRIDPGYRTEDVVSFTIFLPSARYPENDDVVRAVGELQRRLLAMPGVATVGVVAGGIPLGPAINATSFTRTDLPPPEPGRGPIATIRAVDPQIFEALDVPLLAGRGFEETDRHGSPPVAVVTQALVDRFFAGEDPIGKRIDVGLTFGYPWDGPLTIIGVLPRLHTVEIAAEPEPELWVSYAQAGGRAVSFAVHTRGATNAALAEAREVVRSYDHDLPLIRPGTMAELLDAQLARPRFIFLLLGLFAVLAVALAAVGIYGVVAYVVAGRTREIGVRIALGADRAKVLRLVLAQGLRPGALGIGLGLAGALAGARVMRGLLYGIQPQDPITFVAVTFALFVVIIAACLVPARRATRISPTTALRSE